MRITEVNLPTRNIGATTVYYGDVLGLPVAREGEQSTVLLGRTRLIFQQRDYTGAQHLAFTIPTGSFRQAKAWLAGRASLLARDGVDEFEASASWNARSVYFDGPDGQVLELIERRELDNRMPGQFAPDHLLCVSEIGIAVPDVLDAVTRLRDANVEPYGNPPSEGFAAAGDANGMLILVTAGRAWMPTTDRYAQHVPVTVHADDVRSVHLTDDQLLQPAGSDARTPNG